MKKSLLLLSLVMALFTSCDSGEMKNESIITEYMINRVIEPQEGKIETYSTQCVYYIDWINSVMNIQMKSIDSKDKDVLLLKKVSFKYTSNGYTFDIPSIIPELNGAPQPETPITNLKGLMLGNEISFQMTYNGHTIYTSIENPKYLYSNTVVVDVEKPTAQYTNKDAQYLVEFDVSKMKADIKIYGAKFADKMPALNMVIPGVPVVATAQGFVLDIESVIPTIEKTPYPKYIMTNVKAVMIGSKLDFTFICAGKYNTTVKATMHEPKKEN